MQSIAQSLSPITHQPRRHPRRHPLVAPQASAYVNTISTPKEGVIIAAVVTAIAGIIAVALPNLKNLLHI